MDRTIQVIEAIIGLGLILTMHLQRKNSKKP